MLEHLPDAVGHALRGQRAGLDKIAFHKIDLRQGMAALQVTSLAFADHAPIPARYTSDGEGVSPPLQWRGVPATAQSVVVIVEDADAPTPQPLVHAIAVGLAGEDAALPEGAFDAEQPLPQAGADAAAAGSEPAAPTLGRNSFLGAGWLPPDPPPGHGVHRYVLQVFALSDRPAWSGTPGRDAVLEVLAASAIASGCLVGTYERPDGSERVSATAPGLAAPG